MLVAVRSSECHTAEAQNEPRSSSVTAESAAPPPTQRKEQAASSERSESTRKEGEDAGRRFRTETPS